MEKGPGKPPAEPEVLVMDEPPKPRSKVYLVFLAVFIAITLVIAANWGFLSELVKEDKAGPKISSIKTRSDGYDQEVKFTITDDRNLPIKVRFRMHFWNASNDSVPKSKWSIDKEENFEVRPGTTSIRTLPFLPNKPDMWTEGWYSGWYVWVDATDYSGKKTTGERCVFPTQWDPDW